MGNIIISKCNNCQTEYELELIEFNIWDIRKTPSIFECPNCSTKYYIREPQWLKSLKWNGIKISTRYGQEQINTRRDAFNIDLDSKEVFKILKTKGITHFHHANTVTTAKSYLEANALLSREYIEKNKLFQTGQSSDSKDKEFGIHNFIFLDAKDLADFFSRPNDYGPVLFKLDLKLLLSEDIPTVRISRENPFYWKDSNALNDQYYNNLDDFKNEYSTGNKLRDGKTMFMITTLDGSLSLEKYLQEITVDNPHLIFTDNRKLITTITDFLEPELTKFGIQLQVLDRFQFGYNRLRVFEFEKYKKFFTTKRE